MEGELAEILDNMKDNLPQLIVYERIYKNLELGRRIAKVYNGIIYFSRETITYYVKNHGYSE